MVKRENDTSLIHLRDDESQGNLMYEIAYKTVGNTEFFKNEVIRHFLSDCLDYCGMRFQVKISHIEVFPDGVSFICVTPLDLDLHRFLMRTAQYLMNQINQEYPDLELKSMAPNGVLSRLWHRPYYIRTVDGQANLNLDDYFA